MEQLHLVLETCAAKGTDQVSLINDQVDLIDQNKIDFNCFS